ncbi:hypothetical protein GCM10007860_17550 [Chitiniphilus shinanonensis]|uniref:Phosphate/phosphite/phosphonate ABC transporter substrate-binding protein n=1 Tax=Chitiniphilus shinanonensis TaxID=553088 RepID=A0ABQ6BXH6_9NEIS|nr:PhnD/SsuA/transferrin family substrate-binding protein [Chitiniphilus shinanonensis]GLS04608.1 hypothetical protein GCM10007860_17550 [Chitiniphilus shinanonensis]
MSRLALAIPLLLLALSAHAEIVIGLVANRGVEETRLDWQPIADDLGQLLNQPARVVAVKNEAELLASFQRGEIDVLRGSSKVALSAVEGGKGEIFARLALTGRQTQYRSLLLVRRDGPASLDTLLAHRQQYRYASGNPDSTAGYLIPQYHAFVRNNVLPERFFRSVTVGNAEDNFRALVERRVDVAVSNTDDLPKLAEKYPRDYQQLRVLWQSPPFSYDPLVIRRELPAATRSRIASFFLDYGRNGPDATRAKEKLYWADQLDGFLPATNRQLREVTDLQLYDALFRLALMPELDTSQRQSREKLLYRRYDQLTALLGGAR